MTHHRVYTYSSRSVLNYVCIINTKWETIEVFSVLSTFSWWDMECFTRYKYLVWNSQDTQIHRLTSVDRISGQTRELMLGYSHEFYMFVHDTTEKIVTGLEVGISVSHFQSRWQYIFTHGDQAPFLRSKVCAVVKQRTCLLPSYHIPLYTPHSWHWENICLLSSFRPIETNISSHILEQVGPAGEKLMLEHWVSLHTSTCSKLFRKGDPFHKIG